MAKIQLMALLPLDGCLLERQLLSALQDSRDKYGITRIRRKAVRFLEEPVSFVSLSRWKEEGDGIAPVETYPDTLPPVDNLLRFWMVDEIVIYLIPRLQGDIRLFGDTFAPSIWKLIGNRRFDTGICRLDHLHTGCWMAIAAGTSSLRTPRPNLFTFLRTTTPYHR